MKLDGSTFEAKWSLSSSLPGTNSGPPQKPIILIHILVVPLMITGIVKSFNLIHI